MASRFALFFLSSLLIATSFRCSIADDLESDDPVIRQVVGGGDNELLSADHHFSIFKKKFGKSYATQQEHDYRLSVFKANLRRARRHQKIDPSAEHGVTQFSDLTPREFRKQFLGLNRRLRLPSDAHKAPILPTNDLPTDFDWTEKGAVTPVKNQVWIQLGFFCTWLIWFDRFWAELIAILLICSFLWLYFSLDYYYLFIFVVELFGICSISLYLGQVKLILCKWFCLFKVLTWILCSM